MAYRDEVEVTDDWYIPHFPARSTHPLEMAMVRHWKEYMSYEDYYGGMWSSRLACFLSNVPRCLTLRQARVAATFALWTATPNGRSVDQFFEEIKPDNLFSPSLGRYAAHAWAELSFLSSSTQDFVNILMCNEKREWVYGDRPYATLEDYRIMQATFTFLLSDRGRDFLKKVCTEAGINWRYDIKKYL